MSHSLPLEQSHPLDRKIAREAATWLVRLRELPSTVDIAACERWRSTNPEHERAWQLAQQLNAKFDTLPTQVSMTTLGRERQMDRRAAIKTLTVLLLAAPVSYQAYRSLPWREWRAQQSTAIGERRSVMLADGTRVDMNTATAFDINFDGHQRQLILYRGEILVETGPDTNKPTSTYRPFVVHAQSGQIRALGTRFVVRDDGDDDVLVAVLHGAVEVTPRQVPHAARIIQAGQQVNFSAAGVGSITIANSHIADWSLGVLFADGMRLDDFLAQLSRYRRGLLRCDPAVAALRITGAFQLDSSDRILAMMPEILPVALVYRTRYWVTVIAGPDATT